MRSCDSSEYYVREIRRSYSGTLIDVYFLKVNHYVVATEIGDTLDLVGLTQNFEEYVNIGDVIDKPPNSNFVFVDGQKIDYFFLDHYDSTRYDWPDEWE